MDVQINEHANTYKHWGQSVIHSTRRSNKSAQEQQQHDNRTALLVRDKQRLFTAATTVVAEHANHRASPRIRIAGMAEEITKAIVIAEIAEKFTPAIGQSTPRFGIWRRHKNVSAAGLSADGRL